MTKPIDRAASALADEIILRAIEHAVKKLSPRLDETVAEITEICRLEIEEAHAIYSREILTTVEDSIDHSNNSDAAV